MKYRMTLISKDMIYDMIHITISNEVLYDIYSDI